MNFMHLRKYPLLRGVFVPALIVVFLAAVSPAAFAADADGYAVNVNGVKVHDPDKGSEEHWYTPSWEKFGGGLVIIAVGTGFGIILYNIFKDDDGSSGHGKKAASTDPGNGGGGDGGGGNDDTGGGGGGNE